MSNQVYGNDTPPTPNVYVSQLVTAAAGGGTSVRSLTIADTPTTNNTNAPFLVRNPVTHAVEQRDSSTVPHSGQTYRFNVPNTSQASDAPHDVEFTGGTTADPGLTYNGNGTFVVNAGYSGVFSISWTLAWTANATGVRWTWLQIDASTLRYSSNNTPAVTGFITALSGHMDSSLVAGQTFKIVAYQSSGITLDLLGTTSGPDFVNIFVSRTSAGGTLVADVGSQ